MKSIVASNRSTFSSSTSEKAAIKIFIFLGLQRRHLDRKVLARGCYGLFSLLLFFFFHLAPAPSRPSSSSLNARFPHNIVTRFARRKKEARWTIHLVFPLAKKVCELSRHCFLLKALTSLRLSAKTDTPNLIRIFARHEPAQRFVAIELTAFQTNENADRSWFYLKNQIKVGSKTN